MTRNTKIVILFPALFLAMALLFSESGQADPRVLKVDREIGVGWGESRSGWMAFVSFCRDGSLIASDGPAETGDISGDLTLWSFPDGRLVKRLPGRPIAISADLKYYATSHRVNDTQSGRPIISTPDNEFESYEFSPDGRYIAVTANQAQRRAAHIRIVEIPSGRELNAFSTRPASAIAFSPDGKILASGQWRVVKLWNVASGERVAVLRGHARYIVGLAFSRDGTMLAGGNDVGGLDLWDVERWTRVRSLDVRGGVLSPAFSPDGSHVAVGGYGTGTASVVNVATGVTVTQAKVLRVSRIQPRWPHADHSVGRRINQNGRMTLVERSGCSSSSPTRMS